jgi:large subunit ribosomal protein L29
VSKLSETRRHIHALDMTAAQEDLRKHRKQLFELRLQLSRGEVKNNRQFAQVKADIARLMYHISELNREAQAEAAYAAEHEAAAAEPAAESTAGSTAKA